MRGTNFSSNNRGAGMMNMPVGNSLNGMRMGNSAPNNDFSNMCFKAMNELTSKHAQDVKALQAKLDKKYKDVAKKWDHLDTLSKEADKAGDEINKLNQQIQVQQKRVDARAKELKEAKAGLAQLWKEIDKLEKRSDIDPTELANTEKQINELEALKKGKDFDELFKMVDKSKTAAKKDPVNKDNWDLKFSEKLEQLKQKIDALA